MQEYSCFFAISPPKVKTYTSTGVETIAQTPTPTPTQGNDDQGGTTTVKTTTYDHEKNKVTHYTTTTTTVTLYYAGYTTTITTTNSKGHTIIYATYVPPSTVLVVKTLASPAALEAPAAGSTGVLHGFNS